MISVPYVYHNGQSTEMSGQALSYYNMHRESDLVVSAVSQVLRQHFQPIDETPRSRTEHLAQVNQNYQQNIICSII